MIPSLLLLLSIAFDSYYQYLEREKLRLIRTGHTSDRDKWVVLKQLTEELRPFVGFLRFVDPVICLLATGSLLGHEYPWPMYVVALVVGLMTSYYKLLYYFKMVFRAIFIKSPNPHHNRKWLLRVAYSSVRHTFASEYPTSHAFICLALRLLVCKTIGHRWKDWEAVKYGDFGSSRMCKACLVHENQHNGVHRFSETHGGSWRGVVDPNAVFRRKYTGPKP